MSTGVMIRIVGVMSSAVPTSMTSTIRMKVSSILLPMNGSTIWASCPGISAAVISQADTPAAETRNMMTAVVSEALRNNPNNWESLISR